MRCIRYLDTGAPFIFSLFEGPAEQGIFSLAETLFPVSTSTG